MCRPYENGEEPISWPPPRRRSTLMGRPTRATRRATLEAAVAHALVLNATYEPLCVVPMRRAVVLVLAEKAVVVERTDGTLHSERQSVEIPSVVRLSHYVRVPYRKGVPLTRRAVLERDSA